MCFGTKVLEPGETLDLNIGYHDAQPPCERTKYNYDRPEGQLLIKYHSNKIQCSRAGRVCENKVYYSVKLMELHLKDETKEYTKYREQFLEIRKEQARRARWGHLLVNEDSITIEKYKNVDGLEFKVDKSSELDALIPTDLKQFDALSDEEFLKIRKRKIAEMKREELLLDYPETWMGSPKKWAWIDGEKPLEKVPTPPKSNSTKSKISKASTDKKPVDEKSERPKDPPQKVPTQTKTTSTNSKVSTKTDLPPTNQKPAETANKKNEKIKKKKGNPCCTIM
ncbi:hypothetical protein CAEBREN_01751 [Caenorhabditis brenneri]|uniref:Uncharacterized protein n=1 Tax=Caenorhabditis brenneri TaxID=135651 RepID=G0MUN9_CAEBE|nr:hypothetical protein CAEBREN_01751 [Caenorhabditis brenneri]